jgi:ABC-2 type transport system permease protein
MKRYIYYWLKAASLSLQSQTATRPASLMFMAGKFIRFFFFIWFLVVLENRIQRVAGYTLDQLIIFYLVFNLFDLFGQFFFRGIYWFRNYIISGNFDLNLSKPLNPLFQVMSHHTDFLDLPLLIVVTLFLVRQILSTSMINLSAFALVSISGMILVVSFHIIIAALGVITTEVDHAIMVYRDLSMMARVPVDIYADALRALLTFVIPIAIVFTFPAKALMALLSPTWIAFSLLFSVIIFWFSLKIWRYALTQYSSASS